MGAATVAAVLVCHDGARWLPNVLDGLAGQHHGPDRVVAVDTGPGPDGECAALLRSRLGADAVVRLPPSTGFPEAVRHALDRVGEAEWIWLLHDDSAPAPEALAALRSAVETYPEADALGPKLREWPSLRGLLELGVTISGTGRRETGLERGEYDQGQHDEVRRVLAVNTAGMLVRRSMLDRLGGFDPQLPVFGNDLDLGWRAAASGHTVLVVPSAVVFHAEAAHRGVRRTELTGRHAHHAERRAALYILLANCRRGSLPLLWLRLLLGTVLRTVGLLLTRRPGLALDETAALASLYTSPREVLRARRERQELHTGDQTAVRRLLAPWWLPYRHGLDAVVDLLTAVTNQAQDVAERRRAARVAAVGGARVARGHGSPDDGLGADTGLLARFVTSPVAMLLAVVVVLGLVATLDAFGAVAGGALSGAPDEAGDWWRLYAEATHPVGVGSTVPAPPYLPVLAVLATLLGGEPAAAVSVLLLVAFPLGLWGAWRFLRVVGHLLDPRGAPGGVLVWGATSYALVGLVSGAWHEGRFGTVVVAALLPWLAHAALGFIDPEPDRRRRAGWRTGLLLAGCTAFVPLTWAAAVLLVVVLLVAARLISRDLVADRSSWGPPLVALAVVPVLLAPWLLPLLVRGEFAGLLLEAGAPTADAVGRFGVLLGRLAEAGAPWWLGALLAVLAVVALLPGATRVPVLACWVVAAAAALGAAALGTITVTVPGLRVGAPLTVFLLVVHAALVTAVLAAAQGLSGRVPRPGPTWGRAVVLPLALAAVVVPVGGLAWAVGTGSQLGDAPEDPVPAYMTQRAEHQQANGVLVVRGSLEDGLGYHLRRDDGITVGEDEVLALTAEDEQLTRDLRSMFSQPAPEVVPRLAARGVEYLLLPAPADGRVAAVLDATAGLLQASSADPGTRAWQLDAAPDTDAVRSAGSWWRTSLLALQGLALLVVAVLCGPTRRQEP